MKSTLQTLVVALLGSIVWQAQADEPKTNLQKLNPSAHFAQLVKPLNVPPDLLTRFNTSEGDYSARSTIDERFRSFTEQLYATYLCFVGNYVQADRLNQRPSSIDPDLKPTGRQYLKVNAMDAIGEIANEQQIIFMNESHSDARGRALLLRLLPVLKSKGFEYFAAEAIDGRDIELQSRGYPTSATGFYTNDPVFGELVRTAIKLSFKIVAYEADETQSSTVQDREQAQAQNLYARIFKKAPHAKAIVLAGYDHIAMAGEGEWAKPMAARFFDISGIRPFSIDQTILVAHPHGQFENPVYSTVKRSLAGDEPIMFVDDRGKPWSLEPKAYAASVFFPADRLDQGRPTWLSIGGSRSPHRPSIDGCAASFPCLIEARPANEARDAVASDRILVREKASKIGYLYLGPGKYTATYWRANGSKEEEPLIQHSQTP